MDAERTTRYRRHASRCREHAEQSGNPAERELLLELAHHWDAIADLHERVSPPGYEDA